MSSNPFIVTVDGPSGAGKGTLCILLAKELGFNLLDSGAIYRVLALAALQKNIPYDAEEKLTELAINLNIDFIANDDGIKTILDGKDISKELRHEETGIFASKIAALPKVRAALLDKQRSFAGNNWHSELENSHLPVEDIKGLVADGRDMGTVVFPEAQVKIFLDASAQERATRRFNQLQEKNISANFDDILTEIQDRDARDRNRAVAPLKAAEDALIIDSTSMSIEEVMAKALDFIELKI